MPVRTVLTIGNFDGVHIGHAALIARARALADGAAVGEPGRVIALAFDPHPATVLRPETAIARLSTFEDRSRWLREAGADDVVRLVPERRVLDESPAEFVARLVAQYLPLGIVEGRDFRFGRGREGDVDLLARLGRAHGFEVAVVDPVETSLIDQTIVTASSTMIRWLVANGRVGDAERLLGRPYQVVGEVVRGDRRGRELGFPTANVNTVCALPADGVYAGIAELPDGRRLAAAIHVGPRDTFGDPARSLEAHILDWSGPLAEPEAFRAGEYGWTLRLYFTCYLRDLAAFDGVAALVEQIQRDVERTREIVLRSGVMHGGPATSRGAQFGHRRRREVPA